MKNCYSPNDFKHLNSDSEMIQAAICEANKYGAEVEIPRYNERTQSMIWELDKTILLYSGNFVTLNNCHIRLKDDTYIHFFANSNSEEDVEWWVKANRQYDIHIEGKGNAVLDGGNHNGIFESDFSKFEKDETGNWKYAGFVNYRGLPSISVNRGIEFRNVERVSVKGLRFINQRYWGMNFEFCSHGHISDINFEAMNHVPNQDGVDIRVGCNNFLIENINGYIGDDIVAITNFGRFASLNPNYLKNIDMDMAIHDIIVKNIRSYHTGPCDIIRILNRGGGITYNVQIVNVIDCTPEYAKSNDNRPLVGVRIGDIANYRADLAEKGDVRNITVRDVVTRGRFGVYVANTLVDSVFENIMLTSDAGAGVYFNGCEMENIYIDKVLYNSFAKVPETDIGYEGVFQKVKIDEVNAIHFNNCTGKNINVNNVLSGKNISYVIGGNSDIEIKASNIEMQDENTKLVQEPIKLK